MPLAEYRVQDGIAIVELANPPANAYSYDMFREIDSAILQARMDDGVHLIVVRGKGEKFFCAGADIAMLKSATPRWKYAFCLHANETLLRLENTPKLSIAALNGHTVGGGLEIALACDLRVACRGSGKMGLPEVNLGVLPGTGGTQRLVRVVGRSKAIELMAKGATFSFEEGKGLGLVNEVFEPAGWWERVLEFAASFKPPARASKAVGLIKRAVLGGADLPLESGLALERELQQQLFESQDAREGLAAYVEKRPPAFKGC
mgnify:CR=1 FL=1